MPLPFRLAACAEMLWTDRPIGWRCRRLTEMGFDVGLWTHTAHDIAALESSGARFSIMNGFLGGSLADDDGAEEMLRTARETAAIGKRLGVARLNLLGTALGARGHAARPVETLTGAMWLKARDTLCRITDLADELDVTFALENLNAAVDHPGVPFSRAADTLALVSAISHPRLTLNLDLYHLQIGEGNLIAHCRRALPWIGEIQVADVPGRHEPGTGEISYPAIARALADMGYSGTITLEAWPATTPEAALDAFRAAFTL
jgi:hydroxypyruvate isomerase